MSKSINVKVICRLRPENDQEKQSGYQQCIIPTSFTSLKISSDNQKEDSQTFTFDSVFDQSSIQLDLFEYTAKPMINAALEGINGTLFCYGQTSSGKTFTMEGIRDDDNLKGIIPRAMEYIFDTIPKAANDLEFTVKCQYYQIYNEKIQDLLDPCKRDLSIREDKGRGIWVEDCSEVYVGSKEEMNVVFQLGSNNRTVAATKMNKGSSRSHSLFIITLFQRNITTNSSQTGRLFFVDLAGSEKMRQTGIEGGTGLKEAQNINKSLMTLGMVINALTEGAQHIPYRDSKLTRVLQESLGGNSQTTLIITCSMNALNQSESISTLRFGQRAKLIKNKVIANTECSAKELLIKLNAANEKIKTLESIIGKFEQGNYQSLSGKDTHLKCSDCKKLFGQLTYANIELITAQEDNDELKKSNDELEIEIKYKNQEIYKLNEKIEFFKTNDKIFQEEQTKAYNEIKKHIERLAIYNSNSESLINVLQDTDDDIVLFNNSLEKMKEYSKFSLKLINKLISDLGFEINIYDSSNPNTNSNMTHDQSNNHHSILLPHYKHFNGFNLQKLNDSSLTSRNNQMLGNVSHHINGSRNIEIDFNETKRNTINIYKTLNKLKTPVKDQLAHLKDELNQMESSLNKAKLKSNDYEEIINDLNYKLELKDAEYKTYKSKTIDDFAIKEQMTVALINKINDLEDQNYKLLNYNKDTVKKKFIIMDKQIKQFTIDLQKYFEENNRLKTALNNKESELTQVKNELNKMQKPMLNEPNMNMSFAKGQNSVMSIVQTQIQQSYHGNNNKNDIAYSNMDRTSLDHSFSSELSISRKRSFKSFNSNIIANNKIVKIIQGGMKDNSPLGFFSVILNRNRKDNAISKFASKTSHCQFEKEMCILDNDAIIISNFD